MVTRLPRKNPGLPEISLAQLAEAERRPATPTQDPGRPLKCPGCGRSTFEWTNELERVIPKAGRIVILKHLTGFRCLHCKTEGLDMASAMALSREEATEVAADYALALTKQGYRRAISHNQDLMRVARPDEVERVIVAPVDRDHWLVSLVRSRPRSASL